MTEKIPLARQRVLAGQCPLCGKEAAPYRLCYDHRQGQRLQRMLKRAERHDYFTSEKRGRNLYWSLGPKVNNPATKEYMGKWASPIHMPETDGRGRPRLRGISVDVEETIIAVIKRIGRPCTVEEISEAWGRLRDRRSSPLPSDLATIIAAKDKRERKKQKRAALSHRDDGTHSRTVVSPNPL